MRRTSRRPGDAAKPSVRRSWPTSALVWDSGRSFAPTSQMSAAHATQPTMPPTTVATTPVPPALATPMPPATAARATTPIAWGVAVVSASTSS